MTHPTPHWTLTAGLLLCALALPQPGRALSAAEASGKLRKVEVEAIHHRLGAGYADWHDASIQADYVQSHHVWSGELLQANRFGENGTFIGLSDRITLAPRWDLSLGVGLGSGGRWLPRESANAFVHHRWAQQGNWVTHLGTGHAKARESYRDRWSSLGVSAYLEPHVQIPLVVQAEVRWSRSDPGSVNTRQQFVALSWGHQGFTQITARHGWGREGWQLLDDANTITNFASRQNTLTVQHWISSEWGLKFSADHYRNDSYSRRGLGMAVFREWP